MGFLDPLFFFFRYNLYRMRRRNDDLVKISLTAILMTLSIVMSRFLSTYLIVGGTPLVEIGFHTIPVLVCSLVCGPFYGAVCGGGVDLITALAFPVGPFFPGFTIDSALLGLIPGLTMRFLKGRRTGELLFGAVIVIVSAVGLSFSITFVEELKIGSLEVDLPLLWRILIPLCYALLAFSILVLAHVVDRRIKKKGKRMFTLLDSFLSYYSRDLFLRPFIAPVWLLFLYGMPYEVSFLSQLLSSFIVLPIKAAVFCVVLYPVGIVCRHAIEATYIEDEKVYTKLYKGKSMASPFSFL